MVARRRFAKKRRARKPARKAPRRVRGHRNRKAGLQPTRQYATIVETLASNDVFSDTPYQGVFQLSQFFRATTLAKNFQYYRAKKVKWEYMPLYNTFQEGNSTGTVGKPQMYFLMNRDQDKKFNTLAPVDALFSIQCAGADPTPFVKNKEIIYKPNWCSPGLNAIYATAQPTDPPSYLLNNVVSLGLKKQYGWLPTPNNDAWQNAYTPNFPLESIPANGSVAGVLNNAAVMYNGHNFYIQQENEPDTIVGKVICTVEWEFKGGKQFYATPIGTDLGATK